MLNTPEERAVFIAGAMVFALLFVLVVVPMLVRLWDFSSPRHSYPEDKLPPRRRRVVKSRIVGSDGEPLLVEED